MQETGVADTCYIGPEAEFFIFDDIRFDQNQHKGYFYIDSEEGEWNRGAHRGAEPRLQRCVKEGYFPVPPADASRISATR